MDNSIIEDKGVNAVSEYLSDIGFIKPYLSCNDKTPMWDGSIFVYKTKEDFNNDRFDYRVPVQVKSSEFKGDEFPKTTTYAIEITDLKNYLNDGGLAFFKVLINEKQKVVYCSFLTKAVIEEIIGNADGQRSKTITLGKAPEDGKEVLAELRRIYLLRNHPQIDLSILKNRTDFKFSFQLDLQKGTDVFEYIATHYIDVLFSINGIPGEFYPKGGPVKMQMSQIEKCDVIVGNTVYYTSYRHEYKDDGIHAYFGNSVDILIPYLKDVHKNTRINYRLKADTIEQAIRDLEFIIALRENKCMQVGNFRCNLPHNDDNIEVFKELNMSLRFWKDVKKVFEIIHLPLNIKPELITEEEKKDLRTLIHAFINNKPVYGNAGKDTIYVFEIAGLKIYVFAQHIQGREFRLFDIYDNLSTIYMDEKRIRRVAPAYSAVFEMKELPSNLYLKSPVKVYKWYKQYNNSISLRANQDLLNMLNHYDCCHDERILEAALEIAIWLKNERNSIIKDSNILILNYFQIILRKNGALDDLEKRKLKKLNISDNTENFARYILLGDKKRAYAYLEMIPEEEKAFLKTLPIYHFVNEQ